MTRISTISRHSWWCVFSCQPLSLVFFFLCFAPRCFLGHLIFSRRLGQQQTKNNKRKCSEKKSNQKKCACREHLLLVVLKILLLYLASDFVPAVLSVYHMMIYILD